MCPVRSAPDPAELNVLCPIVNQFEFMRIELCDTIRLEEFGRGLVTDVHDDVRVSARFSVCTYRLHAVGKMLHALIRHSVEVLGVEVPICLLWLATELDQILKSCQSV